MIVVLKWNQTILWTLFILSFSNITHFNLINRNVTHEYLQFWVFVPLSKMHKKSPANLFHIYTKCSYYKVYNPNVLPGTLWMLWPGKTVKLFCLIINVFCSGHILPVAFSLPISRKVARKPVTTGLNIAVILKNLMFTSRCYLCLYELHDCNYNPIELNGKRLPYYDSTWQPLA